MHLLRTYLLLVFAALFSFQGKGQDTATLAVIKKMENALKITATSMVQAPVEAWRRTATENFIDSFRTVLERPESFKYPFDSILPIKKIVSPDGKLRIITFSLILNNQNHYHYGFIQRKTKKGIELYEMSDTTQSLPQEYLFSELYSNEWIGSIYYGIKQFKRKGITYYTVLGYDGATINTSKKWADVIWFNEEGELLFGSPMFKMNPDDYEPQYRYEMEYANEAIIVLRHETTNKKKKEMIIFSFLDAKTPDFKGIKSAYYPDGTYDFFLLEKKKWVLYKNLMYFDFKEK